MNNIIRLFSEKTNIPITTDITQEMRITIFNDLLEKQDISNIFLMFNGFDINFLPFMLFVDDLQYINDYLMDTYDLSILCGGILVDPWNSKDEFILNYFGNGGIVPKSEYDVMQLWYENRLYAQKNLYNIPLNLCICEEAINLADINILESPEIPKRHYKCKNFEIDNLGYYLSNIKM